MTAPKAKTPEEARPAGGSPDRLMWVGAQATARYHATIEGLTTGVVNLSQHAYDARVALHEKRYDEPEAVVKQIGTLLRATEEFRVLAERMERTVATPPLNHLQPGSIVTRVYANLSSLGPDLSSTAHELGQHLEAHRTGELNSEGFVKAVSASLKAGGASRKLFENIVLLGDPALQHASPGPQKQ